MNSSRSSARGPIPRAVVSFLWIIVGGSLAAQIPNIGPIGDVVRAYTGFQFTEGPAADRQGNLYFSDVQRNRIHKIDTQGQLSTFLENTQGCNGLMFDARGRLVACQSGAGRMIAIDVETRNFEVIAEEYQGKRFNSPNDVVIDRNGGIYFSDPFFGAGQMIQDRQGVYYVSSGGQVSRVIDNLTRPNGVILSPDESTLYVLSAQPVVMAYTVEEPGRLAAGRVLAQLQSSSSGDGMTIDTRGNLYVTRPSINALQVLSPDGASLGTIPIPEAPANCTFGGADMKTLFVTARTSVYTAPMEATGHRFAQPKTRPRRRP